MIPSLQTAKLATGGTIPPLSARTNTNTENQSQSQNNGDRNRNGSQNHSESRKEGQSDAYELTDLNAPNHTTDFEAREARRLAKRVEKLARREDEFEMKFSHSIQFNAVPDWSSHYIAYSNLKKL